MMALESATAAKSTTPQSFTDAQVVVLRVQGGDYAVPINRVQEIVRVPEITRVPHAQAGVEGVINLRGRVLPVVDLASRLGLGITERARSARVVVVDGGTESIGLLVDGVSEVLRVSAQPMWSRRAQRPPVADLRRSSAWPSWVSVWCSCSISTPPWWVRRFTSATAATGGARA